MDKLIIEGGIPLHGKIKVSGSKNAALPILFAAILCDGESKLENVPALRDIATTQSLLETLGCEARREGDSIFIKPQKINSEASYDLVRTMRASVLCLGPLLARTGHARVAMPGGCAIGARPVDQHLKGFEKLGAEFTLEEGYIIGRCKKLRGDRIVFDMPTVGGTENVLMAAAVAEGETVLENAAREPEIVDLANFLIACGAKIEGHGHSVVHIQGNPNLRAASYSVMPDRIEAGTFLVAAGITGGQLEVQNFPGATMENIIEKLRSMGMKIEKTTDGNALASAPDGLECVDVKTLPYPGFPTDMQAQIMALMCMAKGSGLIEESIFENRFMHVPELNRMGAQIQVRGRTALVRGMKKLSGAPVMASDLRASASLVLAGLAAEGTTEVDRIYHLDRGYEHIEDKLNAVGAKIRRVKDFRPE